MLASVGPRAFSLQEAFQALGERRKLDSFIFEASGGGKFGETLFSRDSLCALRQALRGCRNPEFSRFLLTSVARTRGLTHNARREERPGQMAHEYRRNAPGMDAEVYEDLKRTYGEYLPGIVLTYAAVDTTPLFVIEACKHVERWGRALLSVMVDHVDPAVTPLRFVQVVRDAIGWIVRVVEASELGLLEYSRENPLSIRFPVLEDGKGSYRHVDGRLANFHDSIAYLTSQGQAYDALLLGATLFPDDPEAQKWCNLAQRLREKTLQLFWLKHKRTFACAVDRSYALWCSEPIPRPVETLSTVQPSILDSMFFDDMDETTRRYYTEGIIESFFGPDFLTEAGLRAVSLEHDNPGSHHFPYQGPRVVWPVLTARAMFGLARQGYHVLAADLAARIVNAVRTNGTFPELLYAFPDGRIVYDPRGEVLTKAPTTITATDYGEKYQSWTIAAYIAALRLLRKSYTPTPFELGILDGKPTRVLPLRTLRKRFEASPAVVIDIAGGKRLEADELMLAA